MSFLFYLGPERTFSHHAATAFLEQAQCELILQPLASFRELVEKTESTGESFCILPVENSITSSVHESMDLLFSTSLKIVSEQYLPIILHLYSRKGSETPVTCVLSHGKALEQCRNFLSSQGISEKLECSSTAEAAEQTASSGNIGTGFLGSPEFEEDPRFHVLQKNVADNPDNKTRFLILSQVQNEKSSIRYPKVSVLLRAKHEQGSLLKVLAALSDSTANLTRIESRPIPGTDWEYQFWIDYEILAQRLDESLQKLSCACLEYRLAGIYENMTAAASS